MQTTYLGVKLNKSIIIILVLFLLIGSEVAIAQWGARTPKYRARDSKPYIFAIHVNWNAMDDDGRQYEIYRISDGWHMPAFPSSIGFDYYYKNGFKFDGHANINIFNAENMVNGKFGVEGFALSVDANMVYAFENLMNQGRFEPFIFLGMSYTRRPEKSRLDMLSPSFGGGFNFMFTPSIGAHVRLSAKPSVLPKFFVGGNYMQHHFGLVYRFGVDPNHNSFVRSQRYRIRQKRTIRF